MGAIATIGLTDATPVTPVVRAYAPARQGILPNGTSIAHYEDRVANGGVPVGYGRLSMTMSRPTKERKTFRLSIKLETPILEVLSNSTVTGYEPAPTVSFNPLAEISVVLPERSTLQSRKDLRSMLFTLLADTQVVNAIETLEFPY